MLNYVKISRGGGGGSNLLLMEPVVPNQQLNYPGIKFIAIRVFSAVCIILGVLSICIQTAALLVTVTTLRPYILLPADILGHGIWGGAFYLTTGILGINATRKRTKSLLAKTVVMSAISIAVSLIVTPPSWLAAGLGISSRFTDDCHTNYGSLCDNWRGLEWSLLYFHLLALISTIILTIVTSITVCTCCIEPNTILKDAQQAYIVAANGQPIYFHQPEAFQVSHDGQRALFFQKSTV